MFTFPKFRQVSSNQSDSLFFRTSQAEQNMDQNEHIDSPGQPVESGQDSSSWNNAQPGAKRNVSFLKDPGVYEILDLKNNCSYYGESECLLSHLQIHLRQLRNGTHFCKKLQDSFQKTGEKNFQFFVLVSGPEWTSAQKRRDYQDQLIEENSSSCYNQTQAQRYNYPSTVIRPIMYKGRKYNAVRQAVADKKYVSVSRTTLKRQLADPAITDVYYLEEGHVPHGSIPIFAKQKDGPQVFFPSIRAAVQAGFAPNRNVAKRNLDTHVEGWTYVGFDTQGQPLRTYTLKEDDLTFEMYVEKYGENMQTQDSPNENST